MGKRLFTRARQAMSLTDEGQAFYEAIYPHLEALARAVENQSENMSLLRLHLGVLPLFGSQRLFPRLSELRRSHPLLHIDIDTSPHLEDRVGDTLDAAIILSRGPTRGLHAVRLDHNMVRAIGNRAMAEAMGPNPTRALLEKQTFLVHNELSESFVAWTAELDMPGLEPAAIDHYDSGQLMLEAAAQGLGIAIMHDDHVHRAADDRLAQISTVEVESPYSYWFVCRLTALEERPVRIFHDWLVKAGL